MSHTKSNNLLLYFSPFECVITLKFNESERNKEKEEEKTHSTNSIQKSAEQQARDNNNDNNTISNNKRRYRVGCIIRNAILN